MKQINNNSIQVLCLVGPIAAGKETVVEYLKNKGYHYFSLSHRVREETEKRGLAFERKIFQDVGDSLRKEFGNDILARRTGEKIQEVNDTKILVDGVRNPSEVRYFKKEFNATVVAVTANEDIRSTRLLSRNRDTDPKTREAFDKIDKRDRGIGQNSSGNNVQGCIDIADIIIENNGTKEEFLGKINQLPI